MKGVTAARRLHRFGGAAFLAAALIFTSVLVFIPPAKGQTLDECQSLTAAGEWQAGAEACMRVIQSILRVRQAQAGSYCDSDCDHSLNEQPDPVSEMEMSLAYSRATEAEAICEDHLHHAEMAAYWIQQAVYTSSILKQYDGPDPLMLQMARAARVLHGRQTAEDRVLDHHTAIRQDKRAVYRPHRATPKRKLCAPKSAAVRTMTSAPFPESLRGSDAGPAQVAVKVHIDSDGELGGVKVIESSGYPAMDSAALQAALASTYDPAERNCRAVPADARVIFYFDPNS